MIMLALWMASWLPGFSNVSIPFLMSPPLIRTLSRYPGSHQDKRCLEEEDFREISLLYSCSFKPF